MASVSEKPVDFPAWKRQIRKYFCKQCTKHAEKLVLDVLLVDVALKTSFLFDYTCVDANTVRDFVLSIKKEELVTNELTVIIVHDDVFICNFQMLKDSIQNRNVVTVAASLAQPAVFDERSADGILTAIRFEIDKYIEDFKDKRECSVLDMKFSSSVNRTTVFGYLLDYPVLYWYDSDGENCLSMVPLINVKVIAEFGDDDLNLKDHVAWSFSYPDSFEHTLSSRISTWFLEIKRREERQSLFKSVKFHEEKVTLPAVAL